MTAALASPVDAPPRPALAGRRPWPLAIFRHPLGAGLVIVLVVLAVYAPALDGEFLWDDNYLVKGDPLIRSPLFCLEVFRHTLFGGDSNFYRPAQSLTYIFDYWCWGTEPFGYHLTNVLLHALNACLLFALGRRTLPALVPDARPAATDRAALTVAVLWALHPVHSAAVAYVSGRADSLAMCFCLSAWLLCERALASRRPFARAVQAGGAFGCLLLGLCSKEIAFVWLVLFGGWLFVLRPDEQPTGPAKGHRARFAAVAGGLLALGVYLYLRHLPPPSPLPPLPPVPGLPSKWLLMLRALGDYGRLMVFPDRLLMERQVFAAPALANPADPSYYAALAITGAGVLAAFAVGVCLPGRGRRLRRVGAAWFFIGFLPVSNLFSLNASVAEHWLYLPSIGFLLFLAGAALDLSWRQWTAAVRPPAVAPVVLVLLATGALGVRTWLRAHDWATKIAFYQQTIRDGGDFPRDREGLAQALGEAGDKAAAAAFFGELAAHHPTDFSARVNFGLLLPGLGRADEARQEFEAVAADLLTSEDRRAGPREFALTIRMLDGLEAPGDPGWSERRRTLLDRAAGRYPDSWELVKVRLADDEKARGPAAALALAGRFADAHWWHAPARVAVGRLLAAAGQPEEALAAWEQAARLDVRDTEALSDATLVCLARGWLPRALTLQQRAVHRQPASLRQRLLLAQVLDRLGRPAEAARERGEATRLQTESGKD